MNLDPTESKHDLWLGIVFTAIALLGVLISVAECWRIAHEPSTLSGKVTDYNRGYDVMIQDLRIMHWEWERTTTEKKALISDTVRHLYPDYNPNLLPEDLREFYKEASLPGSVNDGVAARP